MTSTCQCIKPPHAVILQNILFGGRQHPCKYSVVYLKWAGIGPTGAGLAQFWGIIISFKYIHVVITSYLYKINVA